MSGSAELDYADNPYRSTAVATEEYASFEPGDEIVELAAYVGPRSGYYLRKWARRLADPKGDVGINWVAFFFPSLWMAYRKMYLAVIAYFAVTFLLGVAKEIVFILILHQPQSPLVVNLVFNALIGLVCALYANAWYLAQARRTIAALRAQGFQDQELQFALARRGGTSVLAIFVVNLLAGLVLGVAFVVLLVIGVALQSV